MSWWNESPHSGPRLASIPRSARFIFASRHVVGFCSCPNTEMSLRRPAVRFDELLGLHEHPARAAGRIEDATVERLQHLDHQPDDRARRVELAAEFALSRSELTEEVLIDPAEDIQALVLCAGEILAREGVDQPAEHHRGQFAAGVPLR